MSTHVGFIPTRTGTFVANLSDIPDQLLMMADDLWAVWPALCAVEAL
jgi:hypothetical protein